MIHFPGMMVQGLEQDAILDRVRSAGGKRTSVIEKADLKNVASKLGLGKNHRLNSEDSVSVRLMVQDMESNNELLLFKDQGDIHSVIAEEDFVLCFMTKEQRTFMSQQISKTSPMLICMDSTHGISKYQNFQLTTIMLVSDLNMGYPAAFMISSTVNTDIVTEFIKAFKDVVGPIHAKVFMSDDDCIYRNAWKQVMEIDQSVKTKYLLCSWHVYRAIRKNIASKISAPVAKKHHVYHMFRVLFEEHEESKFMIEAENFLKFLDGANLIEFKNYIEEFYLKMGRVELWAKCYRQDSFLNTNNHLESMHRLLKYVYLDGKQVKRLDDSLNALKTMVKNQTYNRMINLLRNRTSSADDFKKHAKGKELNVIQIDQGIFEVQSESKIGTTYRIESKNLSFSDCLFRCNECNVCRCMFVCECNDNQNGTKNLCKHIHAVMHHMKNYYIPR